MKLWFFLCFHAALLVFATKAPAVFQEKKGAIPDLTQGDSVPANAKHDWNLGPTGLRGWMYCDRLVTTDARQIAVTEVATGSPADGLIAVGDVLLGVGGKPFSYDPRTEMGRAITAAETDEGAGRLLLTRWRAGQVEEVALTLKVMGAFGETAPYDCPKSHRILEEGLKVLAEQLAAANYPEQQDPIPRSLNALALLAGGRAEHLPLLKREAAWGAGFTARDFKTWHYGYVMMFLSEYILATGDESVLPGLRRLALEAAGGQSAVGSWGHTFALPDGRLKGYGMMNSPGLPLTIGLVMARKAGVDDQEVSQAIERSARLLRFYTGKGAVPYGDHPAWMETHEDNGKCGMAALLFHLLEEKQSVDFFVRMAVASHGGERDCGHTGNYFNLLWSLPAIGIAGPHATGEWMEEFGGWYHDLARKWDGTFAHQGPPEPDHDSYHGWDATGAYLLGYALPRKKIVFTGKLPPLMSPLTEEKVSRLIDDGRGWNNKDRNSFYDQQTEAELLERLGSWSPIVRERSAAALARRPAPPIDAINELLVSGSLDSKLGACRALEELKEAAAPAVPQLRQAIRGEDLWLRVRAAMALAAIGEPALPALTDMLEIVARGPSPEDPRGMEQRFFTTAIFAKMLTSRQSLAKMDQKQLQAAVVSGLKNQDGHARSEISEFYRRCSYEEIQPLLPAIYEAIVQPAPSGEMFADGVRLNGLRVLAQHRVEEGMQACADYLRTQNPWASEHRTPEILRILEDYGTAAQRLLPHLKETASMFEQGENDFPKRLSEQKARAVRQQIEKIEAAKESPVLRSLE
ncbi:MAG: DUF6288 domain-containing protein [Pirellulaceae bacterium]|jgi:hypothetical protein